MASRSSCPPNAAPNPDRYRDYAGCTYGADGALQCGTASVAAPAAPVAQAGGRALEGFAEASAAQQELRGPGVVTDVFRTTAARGAMHRQEKGAGARPKGQAPREPREH
jgi:F0F1-type ATP synthase membrane subunit c/vacuolar-type H+-ATPase subunit K